MKYFLAAIFAVATICGHVSAASVLTADSPEMQSAHKLVEEVRCQVENFNEALKDDPRFIWDQYGMEMVVSNASPLRDRWLFDAKLSPDQ